MAGQKVLIFEHDRVFAEDLRREFVARGCIVQTVEDGQSGLELALTNRPDLILLSIELPGMNGFAVCNRIKKSPELKDVPLLIVSSEAPPETFEQHSKLRTRAEDYAHKPITPEALAARASAFIALDAPSRDSVELAVDDILLVDDAVIVEAPPSLVPPIPSDPRPSDVDGELDGLTDAAFSSIMIAPEPPAPRSLGQPSQRPPVVDDFEDFTTIGPRLDLPPTMLASPPRSASIPPRLPTSPAMPAVDLAAEIDRLRRRGDELDRELQEARRAAQQVEAAQHAEMLRLRAQADEAPALRRELDELRSRAARPATGATGGVSTREFLELREGLNRKDKEILTLREAVNNRDKELLDLRDRMLQADLSRADTDDRLLEREREMEGLRESAAAATAELAALASGKAESEQAVAALQAELGAAKSELSGQSEALAGLRAELAAARESLAAREEAHAALTADLATRTTALTALQEEHETRGATLLALQGELDTARAEAERAQQDAHAAHAKALAEQAEAHTKTLAEQAEAHAKALADLSEAHSQALQTAVSGSDEALAQQAAAHAAQRAEAEQALAQAAEAHAAELTTLRQAEAQLREAHAAELAALQETATKLREAHAAEVSMLVEAHAADSARLGEEAQLQQLQHTEALAAAAAAAAAVEALRAQDAEAHAQALRDAETARASLETEHTTALGALAAARDAAQREAESLRDSLRRATAQVEHTQQKGARDAELLDRARRALEIAAALVEETRRDAAPDTASPDSHDLS